jgi:UDP-N-acetylglucosamine 4,6-dehydratase
MRRRPTTRLFGYRRRPHPLRELIPTTRQGLRTTVDARSRAISGTALEGQRLFENRVVLITGGTGSFGNAVLRRLLDSGPRELRVLSRDEKKQDDLRNRFNHPALKFHLGDVRDYRSVLNAVRGVDFIFHAAALKQVPSCEFHPIEAVKTNVMGTENVLEAALECGVQRVVALSTDKAVYPINAMGISKALMEKVAVAKSRTSDTTIITLTRHGNVMCSRGSVIPLFIDQIKAGRPITVTHPSMTRFMMTIRDAVDLVMLAFENGRPGELFVPKAPAATIEVLASALTELLEVPNHPRAIIGPRHGEKFFEVLLRREEMASAHDMGRCYRVPPDLRDPDSGGPGHTGEPVLSDAGEYTSRNTRQLDVPAMKALLASMGFMDPALHGEHAVARD